MAKKAEKPEPISEEEITAEQEAKALALRKEDEALAHAFASKMEQQAQKLAKIDDEDDGFVAIREDFWQPEKEGDTLVGAYLGVSSAARVKQYVFGVVDGKERLQVRVNGGYDLKRVFGAGRIEEGTICRLKFMGTKQLEGGKTLRKFEVAVMR